MFRYEGKNKWDLNVDLDEDDNNTNSPTEPKLREALLEQKRARMSSQYPGKNKNIKPTRENKTNVHLSIFPNFVFLIFV